MAEHETRARTDSGKGGELQRALRELRASEHRFRGILERTADGVLVVGRDGRIRFANPAAGRIWGRDPDDLLGSEFGHPLVAGDTAEIEIPRNAQPIIAELRVVETEWENEPARIVSIRDITDRRKAEERARRLIREQIRRAEAEEAARRSAFLAEASRRLASTLDLDSTLRNTLDLLIEDFADYALLDIVGDGEPVRYLAARDGAARERLDEWSSFTLDPEADTPQMRVFRTGEPLLVEAVSDDWLRQAARDDAHFRLARDLGLRSAIIVPLVGGGGCLGVLSALRTDPERRFTPRDMNLAAELGRRAALALENARLYREAAAANEAKANFLSVMSHELRTPLSAIIGYTDLLDRGIEGEPTEGQRRFLGRIRGSSNHLLQIIEEILAFASTEAGREEVRLERVTLDELIDGVLTVAEPLAQDRPVDFIVEVEEAEAELETDTRKVRQILLNLVSNAFKFTVEGQVRLRAEVDGDTAVFTVHDTGAGIPEDRLDRIFERFWQAEDPMTRRAGGTGLGLAVARGFAELLGGSIEVESLVGDGSIFTVRIPRNVDA